MVVVCRVLLVGCCLEVFDQMVARFQHFEKLCALDVYTVDKSCQNVDSLEAKRIRTTARHLAQARGGLVAEHNSSQQEHRVQEVPYYVHVLSAKTDYTLEGTRDCQSCDE